MEERFLKNILSGYLAQGIAMLSGAFLIPFLIYKLGANTYGLIIIAESLILLVQVASAGAGVAISRYAMYALSQGKTNDFAEYLSTGRWMLFASSGLVVVVGTPLSLFIPHHLSIPGNLVEPCKWLLLLFVASSALSIPHSVDRAVLYAHQRLDLIHISELSYQILRLVCIFAVFSLLPLSAVTLITYGIIHLIVAVSRNITLYAFHKKLMPGLHLGMRHIKRQKGVEILSFSGYTSASRVAEVLYDNAIVFLINFLWSPLFTTIYVASHKFPSLLQRFFQQVVSTLTPTITSLVAHQERYKVQRLLFFYTKLTSLVTFPIALSFFLFSKPIIHSWIGKEFTLSATLLTIHAIPLALAVPFSLCYGILDAHAKVKLPSLIDSSLMALNFGLVFILTNVFAVQLVGIVIVEAIISAVYYGLLLPIYTCRVAEISLHEYGSHAYGRPICLLAAICLLGGFFLGGVERLPLSIDAISCIVILLMAGGYITGAYVFVLDSQERNYIKRAWVVLYTYLYTSVTRLGR